ncbi:HAD family hydrolase [Halorussus gelatinilyticus]|uniref:HAD family hydrolase n=1 Tax=Halorussus gelatinilyticus TaxID=2937524 RepID=A0A8U0IF21_9EURY|nr:HAD family hydrolase [Halorussus gelatinilyticus]UPV99666.1 HAD family hydrolase [Halorussus gelatinilyticus]
MPDYDAILFDNDGVLVEPPSDETLRTAAEDAFRAVGVESPDEEHVAEILRGVTPESLDAVCGVYDLDPDEFWTARDRHASAAQRGEFREATRARYDDVAAIEELSHDFGVVSSNQHATIEFVLDHCEFRDLFDTYYGRELGLESLDRKKPNPHYLDRAMADLGAETALYVGDSESDVVAAHRAGLDSAFVRRDHCRGVELSVEPDYEVTDLWGVEKIVNGG